MGGLSAVICRYERKEKIWSCTLRLTNVTKRSRVVNLTSLMIWKEIGYKYRWCFLILIAVDRHCGAFVFMFTYDGVRWSRAAVVSPSDTKTKISLVVLHQWEELCSSPSVFSPPLSLPPSSLSSSLHCRWKPTALWWPLQSTVRPLVDKHPHSQSSLIKNRNLWPTLLIYTNIYESLLI